AVRSRTHVFLESQITELDGSPFARAGVIATRVMTQGETVRDVRFAIDRPDGTRRILSINAAPISAEGLEVRVVCSINDITEQIAAETALRLAAERAEAANQAKSRFLANMSHEIRTPLNGVLGMAQALEDELTEPHHRRILGIIRESGEMLLGVLNDILDMSKIEAGKLTLEKLPFDPAGVASRIEAMHQPNAAAKGLSFDLRLAPEARGLRIGDPGRLSQVLHNLIGNAVKFTESGGVTVTLDAPAGDWLDVTVRDTGIGMSEAQLARVFEDFEQADGTVTRRFGGTGLGMSIVRRLVDLMEGEIAIDSTPGTGTEVRLHLPLPRASAAAATALPVVPARSLAGLRVLVADDNDTNRLILKTMLTRLEVEAVLVADGRAAVDAWEPLRFDAFLLDISMPVLDGMSALAELRALEAAAGLPPAPALAITANALSHQVAEYAQAGFAAHLGKPFRREDLAAALTALSPAGRKSSGTPVPPL
ncbi:MAG: ATP-binding protein, partial [Pararhodobacter sp.]